MLFANRRWTVMYVCLAGMEVAWFTPFLLLLLQRQDLTWSPVAVFVRLLAGLLMWMLALDILNRRRLDSPWYELTAAGLIVISGLLAVRVWLHGGSPLLDFGWLRHVFNALFNFQQGLRPELVLILANVFLWQRATNATSREMSFFRVSLSFRLGVLLLIIGAGWLSYRLGQSLTFFLWIYFGLGLVAVALARIDDKASEAKGSAGPVLPPRRLAQLMLIIGLTLGAAAGLSIYYTPAQLGRALSWLGPVWIWLGRVFVLAVQAAFWVLTPVFIWLEQFLAALFERVDFSGIENLLSSFSGNADTEQPIERGQGVLDAVPPWVWTGLRYVGVLLLILLVLGLVLLYLEKVRPRRKQAEDEVIGSEDLTFGGGLLHEGLRRWRNLAHLVRRFGLSTQLLAAISVENIYANLCRLARQQGHPRRPAQPPDDYLPVLAQVFMGQEEALTRITLAYMQVHYGDQPVTRRELAQLRADYHRLREGGA